VLQDPRQQERQAFTQGVSDQILEPVVKKWLENDLPFILKEDNDSGHGGGSESNIVTNWKRKNNLDYFFNCSNSPNLSPIENFWQVM
jgi:hypothetical protein